jgi:hypothetical protein
MMEQGGDDEGTWKRDSILDIRYESEGVQLCRSKQLQRHDVSACADGEWLDVATTAGGDQ